jgi:uncharacterized protein YihD (DUF1040 family)
MDPILNADLFYQDWARKRIEAKPGLDDRWLEDFTEALLAARGWQASDRAAK